MAKRKTTEEIPDEPKAEYQVLARRYRPQQFADLVGQEPVAQSLRNALTSGRVAHAYLFTGARGVGKTSTARILAKCLNCEKGPTTTPCDKCDMCLAITSGEDTDVLEIDGASNRGIDEVRDLRANVQYRPSRGRYKIYIIDEVHMLTREAFNALLKTLEEPPAHVKFIFATTEVQKIPITILSRCQRFDFAGIGMSQLMARLEEIVKSEKREADTEALGLIARRAGGSMRDGQSLLDQLLAFAPGKLSVEEVNRLLGSAGEERVAAIADEIIQKRAPEALALLGLAIDHGAQLGEMLDQLIEYWRDMLVTQVAGPDRIDVSMTGDRKTKLVQHAKQVKLDTILAGLEVLSTARQRLRGTSHGRVLLEMALVRLARLEDLVPLAQLTEALAREGPPPRATAPAPSASAPPAATPPPVTAEKKKELTVPPEGVPAPIIDFSEKNLPAVWEQVLSQSGFILQAQLKKVCSLAISGPNGLVIRFSPGYNLPEENLLDPVRLGQVEKALATVLGRSCSVQQELAVEGNRPASPAPDSPAQRRTRSDLRHIPLVGKAMELLEARVVSEENEFGALPSGAAPPGPAPPIESDEV